MKNFILSEYKYRNINKSTRWRTILSLCMLLFIGQMGFAQEYYTVGDTSATGSNENQAYPTPFGAYYYGARHQFYVTATELSNSGIQSGDYISSIGFNILNLNSVPTLNNYAVKIYAVSTENPLSSGWVTTGLVAEGTIGSHSPVAGWNQLALNSGFVWNGTDHLVIETCSNNSTDTSNGNASVQWTSTGLGSATWSRWYRADNTTVCSSTSSTSTSTTTRPNIRFTVIDAPSCFNPVGLSAESTSPTQATVSWAAPATAPEDGYEYTVSLSDTPPASGTATTNTSASVSDLISGNTYYLHVRSVCTMGSDYSEWTTSSFYFGYCTASSSSTGYRIAGFYTTEGLSNITNTSNGTTNAYSDFTALSVTQSESGSFTYNVVVPAWTGAKLWIDWNNNLTFDVEEEVGTHPYASSATTFSGTITVPVGTPLGAYRLRVRTSYYGTPSSACGTLSYGETEDYTVIVTTPPAFPAPTSLSVTGLSFYTATLNWVSPNNVTPDGYEYYYSITNTAPEETATVNTDNYTTDLSQPISGLTQNTVHYWWVRAVYASGNSTWTNGQSFTTLPLASVVWTEGFTGSTTLPLGWTNSSFGTVGTITSLNPGSGNYIYKNQWDEATSVGSFTTLNIGPLGENDRLAFEYKIADYYSPYNPPATGTGNFVVEITTDNGLTWTLLETVPNNGIAGWQEKTYNLSEYEDEIVRIRITANWVGPNDYNIGFDNFIIEPTPEFEVPTSLSVSEIAFNTATFNWALPNEGTPTGYEYYYSTTNTAPEETAAVNMDNYTTNLSQPISGLTQNTAHYWWVRGVYASGNSTWTNGQSFTTLPLASVVWTEGFTGSTTLPLGWTNSNFSSIGTVSQLNPGIGNYIYKNLYSTATTGNFTTINIGPLGANDRLKFDYKLANWGPSGQTNNPPPAAGSGNFVVTISTDNGATWITLETVNNNGVAGWQEKIYNLADYSDEIVRVRITGNWISGDYYLGFDNFIIEPTPEFEPPTSLAVNGISFNTANLNWALPNEGTPTGYEYYYSTTNTAPEETAAVNMDDYTTDLSQPISGLTQNTVHYWWVRAVYASGNSTWTNGQSFTTLPLASVVWTEGFTGSTTLPLGWTNSSFETVGTITSLNPGSGNYIYKNQYNGTTSVGSFTTLNIGPLGENDRLAFEYKIADYYSPYNPPATGTGNFVVEITTDNGLTWTLLETVPNNGIAGWQEKTYNLSEYEDEIVRIRITANWVGPNDYNIGFDSFVIEPVILPTSIQVSVLDDASAAIATDDGTLQLVAEISPANATNQNVIWSIESGSEFATVNQNGLVSALDNGTVTVRATSEEVDNVYDEITITITNQIIDVTSVAVATENDVDPVIDVNDGTLQLIATVAPANATNQNVTWSVVTGNDLASVDADGLVAALDNGSVTVRATSDDDSSIYDEITITITNQIIDVTSVVVATENNLDPVIDVNGGTLQLIAIVVPANATNQNVTWSVVTGNDLASVDANGLVFALANGEATIRATSVDNPDIYDEIVINISNQAPDAQSIIVSTLNGVEPFIENVGEYLQLVATLEPAEAITDILWSVTSGSDVASVNDEGLVLGLAVGEAVIRATAALNNEVYGEITITVQNLSTEIILVDNIKLYPNPTTGVLNISSQESVERVEVYNLLGQRVISINNTNQTDLSHLNAGTYIVKVVTARGELTQKVIKK